MVTAEAVAAAPGTREVRTGAVGPVDAVGVTLAKLAMLRGCARDAAEQTVRTRSRGQE